MTVQDMRFMAVVGVGALVASVASFATGRIGWGIGLLIVACICGALLMVAAGDD